MVSEERIQTAGVDTEAGVTPSKLPRRAYWLVPLTSLLTIGVLFGLAEIIARIGWAEHTFNPCIKQDYIGIFYAQPNCDATTKVAEGPWVSYHFNACGYRTYAACDVKPKGTIRIALMGSSIGEGLHVKFEQTMGERTARYLAKATGRNVQMENLSMTTLMPVFTYRRLTEAINLHPDVVIWAVAPFDVAEPLNRVTLAAIEKNERIPLPNSASGRKLTFLKRIQNLLNNNVRASLVAQHFLFSNPNTVIRLFLNYGDRAAYLKSPTTPTWDKHYQEFDVILTKMADRLHQAHIPFILMAVPSREAAALMNADPRPAHTDVFDFSRRLHAMANQLNIGFVDAVQDFARYPHSDQLFYFVDLHIDGRGHGLLAQALERKLMDGSIPAISKKQKN